MTYQDTTHALHAASQGDRAAARTLPLSDWAELNRGPETPQTTAANHVLNVLTTAHDLREAIENAAGYDELADAARALLAAIGEAAR